MKNTKKFRVSFTLEVDRDVYPLSVDDGGAVEDLEDEIRDLMYDIDGFEVKTIKIKEQ